MSARVHARAACASAHVKVRNGLISEPLTVIVWWEALVLLGIYVGYVTFMYAPTHARMCSCAQAHVARYFNEHIEEWVKNVIKRRNQVSLAWPCTQMHAHAYMHECVRKHQVNKDPLKRLESEVSAKSAATVGPIPPTSNLRYRAHMSKCARACIRARRWTLATAAQTQISSRQKSRRRNFHPW